MSEFTDMLTAWGTVGGAVGTVAAVGTALYFSSKDGRRAAERDRRQQAERVTAWIEPKPEVRLQGDWLNVAIRNNSDQPVYSVVISLVAVQGAFRKTAVGDRNEITQDMRTTVGLVPPGSAEYPLLWKGGGMNIRFSVELAFQDSSGRFWLRSGVGGLKEVDRDPVALYHISMPVGWKRT